MGPWETAFCLAVGLCDGGHWGRVQQWQQQQKLTPKEPLSHVDLWIRLAKLLEGHTELNDICKARAGLRVDEVAKAEELALEVLCSHPLQARGGGGRRATVRGMGSQGEFLRQVRHGHGHGHGGGVRGLH